MSNANDVKKPGGDRQPPEGINDGPAAVAVLILVVALIILAINLV